ncbi:testicular acid phosphatase homolog [Uranotaenia lowii]|uniref:testicular acid phosphatase homolog n=1 Tax=Uranotaenia lowii TaxID=190385 RepID=UPI00247867B3|nr:testicular acid phosphatase homolog [Uranotaenia lowii]
MALITSLRFIVEREGLLVRHPLLKGIEQLFALGQNMRKRYYHFIPKHIGGMKRKIYAVSSCAPRCILSAQSFLTGFVQTSNSSAVLKQPVPLNILLPEQDKLLLQNKTCPKDKLQRQELLVHPTPEFERWVREGKVLMNYVSKKIGSPIDRFYDLGITLDTLETLHVLGLKLPSWSEGLFPRKARNFMMMFMKSFTGTQELKHIRGGSLLAEFVTRMKDKRDGFARKNQNIMIYSGHDLTQVSLLNSMEMREHLVKRPECGSAIVFELHQNKMFRNDLEVRMYRFRQPADRNPMKMVIPNCPAPCSLNQFESAFKHLLLYDFEEACMSL